MNYPGRIVEAGDADQIVMTAVCDQLELVGYSVPAAEGRAPGEAFAAAVQYFQSTHADSSGRPLVVDGKVGPNTWGALFGAASVVTGLTGKALAVAEGEAAAGVMEVPPGSNRGPRVSEYLQCVGAAPGQSWCMAFVQFCLQTAAAPGPSPAPRSAGVLDVYHRTLAAHPERILTKADALAEPSKVRPGLVFIYDHGAGLGHTGFVKAAHGAALTTVEGNTSLTASREGVGVFELSRRSITDAQLVCFIDFGA